MELRDYQKQCIIDLRSSYRSGNDRVILQAPTGFGKTVISCEIIRLILKKRPGSRIVITSPRIVLIDQLVNRLSMYPSLEGIRIGVIQSNHELTDSSAPIQVASIQTFINSHTFRDYDFAIIDECHLNFEKLNLLIKDAGNDRTRYLGLSATPWSKGLGLVWQDLVISSSLKELIDQNYLSRFKYFVPDRPCLDKVKIVKGEFSESMSSQIMMRTALVGNVLKEWREKSNCRDTLCFCINVNHARFMENYFLHHGINARMIEGRTSRKARQDIFLRYEQGLINIIISINTLTLGLDVPVGCIIDLYPTCSLMNFVQRGGRGARKTLGNEECIFLDHCGNLMRHGRLEDIDIRQLDKSTLKKKRKRLVEKDDNYFICKECKNLVIRGEVCECGYFEHANYNLPFDTKVVNIGGKLDYLSEKKLLLDKIDFYRQSMLYMIEKNRDINFANRLFKRKFKHNVTNEIEGKAGDISKTKYSRYFLSYVKNYDIACSIVRKSNNRIKWNY